ncbi:MAG: DUF4340 domain-containing protein [Candidatus Brocadiia bacterium]
MKRKLIGLVLGALAVAGLVVAVIVGERSPQAPEGIVFPPPPGRARLAPAIERLEVQREDARVVLERTEGNDWRVRQPVQAPADPVAVAAVLDALGRLESTNTFPAPEAGPGGLKPYGLDEPRLTVLFWAGGERTRFVVGTPGGAGEAAARRPAYVQVAGRAEIHTVAPELLELLDRPPRQFCDLRPCPHEPEEIVALSLRPRGQPKLVVNRAEEGWRVVEPPEAEASHEAVEQAVAALCDLRVLRYVDEAEPQACGLRPPALVVEATTRGGQQLALRVGAPAEDREGARYAAREGDEAIFLLDAADVARLARPLGEAP